MRVAEEIYSETRGQGLRINTRKARLRYMRSAVIQAAEAHTNFVRTSGHRWRSFMVTLTYRRVVDWKPEHISQALKAYREYCRRRGAPCRYVWTAELQERGAVHYHIVVWLPKRWWLPMWDRRGWWPHGSSNTVKVRRNAVGYVAKYASKMANDEAAVFLKFPKGLRIHGCGGLNTSEAMKRRWFLSPSYVREYWDNWVLDVRRAVHGGGWVSRVTGEWLPAKWHQGNFDAPYMNVWATPITAT